MMPYRLRWNSARTEAVYTALPDAIATILAEYPAAYGIDAGGFAVDLARIDGPDALDIRDGRVVWIWENEACASRDMGGKTLAVIDDDEEED